jgi:hypothetical protein
MILVRGALLRDRKTFQGGKAVSSFVPSLVAKEILL